MGGACLSHFMSVYLLNAPKLWPLLASCTVPFEWVLVATRLQPLHEWPLPSINYNMSLGKKWLLLANIGFILLWDREERWPYGFASIFVIMYMDIDYVYRLCVWVSGATYGYGRLYVVIDGYGCFYTVKKLRLIWVTSVAGSWPVAVDCVLKVPIILE